MTDPKKTKTEAKIMAKPSVLKRIGNYSVKHWKLLILVLLISGLAVNWYVNKDKVEPPEYITETATKRDVVRAVSVNGKILSKESRDLFPSVSEKVSEVLVEEGDMVKTGDVLVKLNTAVLELRLGQAQAQLAQAEALLNQQVAGATGSDIALSGNDVQSAQVSLAAAQTNLEKLVAQKETNLNIADLNIRSSEVALKNSNIRFQNTQNNTGQNSNLSDDRLKNALENALIVYRAALSEVKQARITVNSIVKVDRFESEANRYPNVIFGNINRVLSSQVQQDYRNYKFDITNFESKPTALSQFNWTNAEQALDRMKELNALIVQGASLLASSATLASDTIDAAQIEAARSAATLAEQSLLAQATKVQSSIQAIETASLTINSGGSENTTLIDNVRAEFDSVKSQYEQSQINKEQVLLQSQTAIAQAEAEVAARKVAVTRAQNGLNKVRTGPREVDLGSNRASISIAENQVAQAQLALDEAQITSPIDGMVTLINAKTGERPNASLPLVVVKSPELEIIADISESDIGDVVVGQTAEITFDAFSSQDIYTATVVKKAKAETVIQGVIYYQVTLELEAEQEHDLQRVLSGMTADIELLIASREDVFALEPQAIIYKEQQPYVRVLVDNDGVQTVEEKLAELGLEGNTYVEVLSGISDNDSIILYEELSDRSPFQ